MSDIKLERSEINVLSKALEWHEKGRRVCIVSVIKTWGSSPRPVGAMMSINSDGLSIGSVSGGCIEGAVVTEAMEVMKTGNSKVLEYGVTNELAWEVGLACGGSIHVYVEKIE